MFILHGQRKDLHEVYLRLARDYALPLRAAARTLTHWNSFQSLPDEADKLGILHPDQFAVLSRMRPSRAQVLWTTVLRNLPPGLTEVCCHPAYAQGELAQYADDAFQRHADFRFFTSQDARKIIHAEGIELVGYRRLRDSMRSAPQFRAA